MTHAEAKRIIRQMLRRSKDRESADYDMFTHNQVVALETMIQRGGRSPTFEEVEES